MSNFNTDLNISELLGKTLLSIDGNSGDRELIFKTLSGDNYKMYHNQSCCEDVSIDDIVGDLSDLIGTPILKASEDMNHDNGKKGDRYGDDSWTWTFYHLATIKGYVDIKWYGSSNGYYSESVSFIKIKE